jgi:hypothetical protein
MPAAQLTSAQREKVEQYLFVDEDQLWSLIPPYLEAYADTHFSPEGQADAGREWFEALRATLQRRLCDEWQLCRKLGQPELSDTTNLVVVIGDAIATHVRGVPPVLVAAIIVRMGARRFCVCP